MRFTDRWQSSIESLLRRAVTVVDEAAFEQMLGLLEGRDRYLENQVTDAVGNRIDWSTANGHATNLAAAVASSGGGTNWGAAPTLAGTVNLGVRMCTAKMSIVAGGAGQAAGAAGQYRINLPFPALFTATSSRYVGSGVYWAGTGAIFCQFEVFLLSTTQAEMWYPATHLGAGTRITNAVPFALGAGAGVGASLDVELQYEVNT